MVKLVLLVAAGTAVLFSGMVHSQAYPARPLRLIVPSAPGGSPDINARELAAELSKQMGQLVVVENRPGASGTIGTEAVAKAPADGYTLLLAPSTFSIAQLVLKTNGSASYDVLNGFTPIVQAGTLPLALVASSATGFKNFKEAMAAAKTQQLSYASPGSGSPMHILGELVNKSAGVNIRHVPYKGVAPAVNDVLGGHVPLTYITLGPVAPYLPNGKMVALAIADSKRSPLAPNVPTLQELGYAGVDVTAWHGLFGPKGLPADVVKTLNGHMNEILKMPDVISRMATLGALPLGGAPEVLAKTNAADFERFGKLIKDLNIQAD